MSWQSLVCRVRALVLRRRLERDLDDELAFHTAEATARGSVRRFGNELRLREAAREAWMFVWLEALGQDLCFAARGLRRAPGFAAAVIITLALGIGANSAIFSLAYAVLWQPLPYPDAARIVEVRQGNTLQHHMMASPNDIIAARSQALGLGPWAMYRPDDSTLTGAGTPLQLDGVEAEAGVFTVLGAKPLLGRLISPSDDHPGASLVVDISARLWRSHFAASQSVVGTTIELDGKPYTIIGVMPEAFTYPNDFRPFIATYKTSYWRAWQEPPETFWGNRDAASVARLAPGVSLAQAQQHLDFEMQRLTAAHPHDQGWHFELTPLRQAMVGQVTPAIWMMLAVVALVLLIAAANVACLLSARAQRRARELATRTALGASRGRIVRQLLTETVLLVSLGAGAGLGLAALGIAWLRTAAPAGMPRLAHVSMNGPVVAFTAAVAVFVALAFGLAPALGASGRHPGSALRLARTTAGAASNRGRNAWVIAQVALSLLLLVGAGLLLTALGRMLATPLGFNPTRVLSFDLSLPQARYPNSPDRWRFFQAAQARFAALPGVQAAAMTSTLPLQGGAATWFLLPGEKLKPNAGDPSKLIGFDPVSPGYFRLMQIPVLRGRGLGLADSSTAPQAVVINAAAAQKVFPGRNPIGQRIKFTMDGKQPWRTVVGIVANVQGSFGAQPAPAPPAAFVPLAQSAYMDSDMTFVIRTSGAPLALLPSIERSVHTLDPQVPVTTPASLTQIYASAVAQPRFRGYLVAGFAILALLLTAVGIYGVLAYMVGGRTQEYGIRAALGAQPGQVLTLVLRQALVLISIGLTLGLAAAIALTRYLSTLIYGVSPTDPWVLAATIILLAIVSIAAAWLPARRAMAVDPARALRWE